MNYNRVHSQIRPGWLNRVHTGRLPLLTRDQLRASRYLKQRNIFELLNFLLGHILCDSPADPMVYLDGLLEHCLSYRWGLAAPPLLFTPAHIEALFKAFDPGETNTISLQQYATAMVTLGVCTHAHEPPLNDEGRVTKEVFCAEAERCLMAMLDEMVMLPAGKMDDRMSAGSCCIPPAPPPSPATHEHSLESVDESEEAPDGDVEPEVLNITPTADAEREALARVLAGDLGFDQEAAEETVDQGLNQEAAVEGVDQGLNQEVAEEGVDQGQEAVVEGVDQGLNQEAAEEGVDQSLNQEAAGEGVDQGLNQVAAEEGVDHDRAPENSEEQG